MHSTLEKTGWILAALAGLCASASTQTRIWIVDAQNGPGTDFTDLPPAVTAAAAGDSIVVRAGGYTGIRVSKPLSIIAEPNAQIVSGGSTYASLNVSGIPPGATFAASGLDVRMINPTEGSVSVAVSGGTVLLERIRAIGATRIVGSSDVRLSGCALQTVSADGSTVAISRSTMKGSPAVFLSNNPALLLNNSSAVISRSTLTGGDVSGMFASSSAIHLLGGTAILTSDGSGAIAAGMGMDRSAIEGNGSLVIDPNVPLLPAGTAPAIAPGIQVTSRAIPSLQAVGAPPGGVVGVELFAAPGDAYFLFVGLPGPPLPLPLFAGSAWISSPLLFDAGVLPASMRAKVDVAIPGSPLLVGRTFVWQALAGSGSTFSLSNPASYAHGY